MNSVTMVQKLWNYCNLLRGGGGMGYGDQVEQLTYLLFLKMTDERSQPSTIGLIFRKAQNKFLG